MTHAPPPGPAAIAPIDPVGIAGAAALAAPIAARLHAAGMARLIVHGFDLPTPAATTPRPAGAPRRPRIEHAANLFDLASECQVVVTAYPSLHELHAALAGTADRPGLAGAMQPGTLLADASNLTLDETRRLVGLLAPHAIGVVEWAAAGPLDGASSIFAGGFGDHVDRLRPLLTQLGTPVARSGAQGSARLAAAAHLLIRDVQDLLQTEWQATAAGLGLTEPDALPAPATDRACLTERIALLRNTAATHDLPMPLLDGLAVALSLARPPTPSPPVR